MTEDAPDPVWSDWGPPLRVRLEGSAIGVFARALHDENPVFRGRADAEARGGFAGLPAPPTFTFVMAHSGADPDLQPADGRGRLGPPDGLATDDGYSRDGDGAPVVTERIVSIFIPNQ